MPGNCDGATVLGLIATMQHRGDRNGPFPGVMVPLLRFNSIQGAHPAVRKVQK